MLCVNIPPFHFQDLLNGAITSFFIVVLEIDGHNYFGRHFLSLPRRQ